MQPVSLDDIGAIANFFAAVGVLITLIGTFLLWRSARSDHVVTNLNGRTLAVATGMIPCPLTTFILSYALARGILGAGLLVTAAMTAGMIVAIGGVALAASLARTRCMALLSRTDRLREGLGRTLEIGGSLAVLGFGLWTLVAASR